MAMSAASVLDRYKQKTGFGDVDQRSLDLIEALIEEIQENADVAGNLSGTCQYSGSAHGSINPASTSVS